MNFRNKEKALETAKAVSTLPKEFDPKFWYEDGKMFVEQECITHESLVELAEAYQQAENDIKEILKEIDSMFNDEPMNGQYFHVGYCNGGRDYPIGADNGKICNCKNLPLFVRLREQAERKALSDAVWSKREFYDAGERGSPKKS